MLMTQIELINADWRRTIKNDYLRLKIIDLRFTDYFFSNRTIIQSCQSIHPKSILNSSSVHPAVNLFLNILFLCDLWLSEVLSLPRIR